ncbi:hypothetical protein [Marinobacter alkaliphilus]|uniref:Uncharacterized protein n=1 Tax=Marinobacter alkaliphilus TaxID=254719 RepID=A0ABZ3E978_9GAMM
MLSHSQADDNRSMPGWAFWIIFALLFASFCILYFWATATYLPEAMKASRLSLGVLSRVDIAGWVILLIVIPNALLNKQLWAAGLSCLVAFCLLYFSYFGALELAHFMGEDIFVKAVVSEQGCFPEEWIGLAHDRGFTFPSQTQICE